MININVREYCLSCLNFKSMIYEGDDFLKALILTIIHSPALHIALPKGNREHKSVFSQRDMNLTTQFNHDLVHTSL
ncbi:hypothetical protein [Alteromonas naphthalenivorans]|uniref:Uncharacterized protein n=1 Tax=Alteromonas naphthalenivorans TaxID=715451 RepID=F5Z6B5_ALTNA|nr:hypothetical protein [Alteromonas naphthalenivorans]AEF05428.1 hypothetical protein ambt_19685 [Alteromonas naphthalenivorans]